MLFYCKFYIILCVFFGCNVLVWATHFRGGTISWKFIGPGNKVEFEFRLGWLLGHADTIGKWNAVPTTGGASFSVGSVNYKQTGSNTAEQWEQGENTFIYDFPGNGPFKVSYQGFAWISLGYGSAGAWNVETTVDLNTRSDTRKTNNSPLTTSRAMYRVQFECDISLQIPGIDPDGDNVRCRWATSAEAASISKVLPNAHLDEESCLITFTTTTANNYKNNAWFAVALTIEDFPRETITINGKVYTPTTAISSIPLQFLIKTQTFTTPCDDKPDFVTPTPTEGVIKVITTTNKLREGFYVNSSIGLKTIDVTGPNGTTVSSLRTDSQGRPNVWYVAVTWTPTSQSDQGSHFLCASAEDNNSKLSNTRCFTVTVIAGGMDHCKSEPCLHGGTCTNEYGGFTCDCPKIWNGHVCEFRKINRTEECTDLEYTECSCYIKRLRQLEPKSYKMLSGLVGAIVGMITVILFYIALMHQGNNVLNNHVIPTKVNDNVLSISDLDSQSGFINTVSSTDCSTSKEAESIVSAGPIHCDCFVDHTGYDHFQRYDPKSNRFKLHKCHNKKTVKKQTGFSQRKYNNGKQRSVDTE